ncbi:MAG: helix-turn-helix domain-containing protein [Planctomycetota bacterium]
MSGNKTRAAKALGIDRRKLYRLVEKYSILTVEIRGGEADPSAG